MGRPEGFKNPHGEEIALSPDKQRQYLLDNIFEAGADEYERCLKILLDDLIDHYSAEGNVFSYGGVPNCEYGCIPGLKIILEGKAKQNEDGDWVIDD